MTAVADLYDAITDDEAFTALPERIASLAGARSAAIHIFDPDGQIANLATSYFSDEMSRYYLDHGLHEHDLWRKVSDQRRLDGQVVNFNDIVTPERFRQSVFYNEFFRRFGDDTAQCLGGVFHFEGGVFTIGTHRAGGAEAFSADDLERLAPQVPHLRRIYQVRTRFSGVSQRADLSEAALKGAGHPLLIVDGAGRPLLVTSAAETVLATSPLLKIRRGRLTAAAASDDQAIAQAISTAANRAGGGNVRLSSDERELRLLISPVDAGGRTAVLILLDDPAILPAGRASALTSLYGLTAGEARAVMAIVEGLSPAEAADRFAVGLPTVRTQLSNALRKTGARSLIRLVQLVSTLPSRPAD